MLYAVSFVHVRANTCWRVSWPILCRRRFAVSGHTPPKISSGFTGRCPTPEEDGLDFSLLTTPTFNRGRATQIRYNEDNCIVDVCTRRTCVLHTKHSWPIYRYHFRDIILQTVKTSNHSGLVNFHIMLEQFREHRDGTNPINGQPFWNVRWNIVHHLQ